MNKILPSEIMKPQESFKRPPQSRAVLLASFRIGGLKDPIPFIYCFLNSHEGFKIWAIAIPSLTPL